MKLCQKAESEIFKNTHQQVISRAETLITAAANEFLAGECKSILAASTIQRAEHALSMNNLQAFASVLRPEASSFSRARVSSRYWDLIDSIGHLETATGCYWPYVTQETRKYSLKHAIESFGSDWACAA
jgi:hypothetical protein